MKEIMDIALKPSNGSAKPILREMLFCIVMLVRKFLQNAPSMATINLILRKS